MVLRDWLKLMGLSLMWGGSFLFIEVALEGFSPLVLVLLRVAMASVTLWVVALAWGHRLPREPKLWLCYAVMGLLSNVLPFSLISWGQQHVTAGVASILNATTPLFTMLIAQFATQDERLTPAKVAGVVVGFAGVVVLMLPEGGGLSMGHAGQLAVLGAALCYGCGAVYAKRVTGRPAIVNAAGMLTCSAAMLLPVVALTGGLVVESVPMRSWLAVLALSQLSTALAYLTFFTLLRSAGATNLSLVTFLVPVTAVSLGVVVLGESLPMRAATGVVIVFAGLALTDGRLLKLAHRPGWRPRPVEALPVVTPRRP